MSDGLAFMLSAIFTRGASAESKAAETTARAVANSPLIRRAANYAGLSAPTTVALSDKIGKVSANALTSFSEALFEAKDAKEQSTQMMKLNRMRGEGQGVGMTDEEIDLDTSKRAANVFALNAAVLGATNSLEMEVLFGNMFKNSAAKSSKYGLELVEGKVKSKSYEGLSKFLFDKGYAPGVLTKKLATAAATESFEESLQYSIQRINEADKISEDFAQNALNFIKTGVENFNIYEKDRAKSMLLGAIVGTTSVGAAWAAQRINPKLFGDTSASAFSDARSKAVDTANKLGEEYSYKLGLLKRKPSKTIELVREGDAFFKSSDGERSSITQEDFETLAKAQGLNPEKGGEYLQQGEVDLDNGPQIDENKLFNYAKDTKLHSELQGLLNVTDPTSLKYKVLRRQKLASMAKHYHAIGEHDLLEDVINSYRELDHAARYEAGFNTVTDAEFQAEIDSSLGYVRKLKDLNDTVDNSIPNRSDNSLARKTALRELGGRILALEELLQDSAPTDEVTEQLALRRFYDNSIKGLSAKLGSAYLSGRTEEYTKLSEERRQLEELRKALPKSNLLPTTSQLQASKVRAEALEASSVLGELRGQFDEMLDYTKPLKKVSVSSDNIRNKYTLNVHPNTTKDDIDAYVGGEVFKKARTQRLDNLVRDDFAEYLDSLTDNESIDDLLEALEGYKPSLSLEQASALKGKLNKELNDYEQADNTIDDIDISDEEYEEALQTKAAIESRSKVLLSNPSAARNLIDSLTNLPTDYSVDELRAQTVNELYNSARALVDRYNSNPLEFSSEKAATQELLKVAKLSEHYPVSDSQFLLETLTEARDTAIRNLQDKDIALAELEQFNKASLASLLKSSTLSAAIKGHAKSSKLEGLVDTHPEIVLSYIQSNPAVREHLISLRSTLGPTPFQTNPQKTFWEYIVYAQDVQTVLGKTTGKDSDINSPIFRYRKDYNLARLVRDLPSYNRDGAKVPTQDILDVLDRYVQLRAISTALSILDSAISEKELDRAYAAAVNHFKAKGIVPSSEQRRTIRQAVRWFWQPPNKSPQSFDNTAYFKGRAGSGKTLVVAPYILRTLGLDASKVLLTGAHTTAAKNLTQAVNGTTSDSPLEVDGLIKLLQNGDIGEARLIVVDEVGYLTLDQLQALSVAHRDYNAKNEKTVKMLLLGDPNQLVPPGSSDIAIETDNWNIYSTSEYAPTAEDIHNLT